MDDNDNNETCDVILSARTHQNFKTQLGHKMLKRPNSGTIRIFGTYRPTHIEDKRF